MKPVMRSCTSAERRSASWDISCALALAASHVLQSMVAMPACVRPTAVTIAVLCHERKPYVVVLKIDVHSAELLLRLTLVLLESCLAADLFKCAFWRKPQPALQSGISI